MSNKSEKQKYSVQEIMMYNHSDSSNDVNQVFQTKIKRIFYATERRWGR